MNLEKLKQIVSQGEDSQHQFKEDTIIKTAYSLGVHMTDRFGYNEDFKGTLPAIFKEALAFIMRNLHKIQNQKSVNSIGDPEIPKAVFEELLVNALIHRDYFITAPIRILVFANRIEIISPGALPNHLTVKKIQAGTAIQRNPTLVLFVAKGLLPYRGLGTGIRRALKEWPHIQFIDNKEGCTFTAIITRLPVQ